MKKKVEFSKLILIGVGVVTLIVVFFTLFMIYITRDMSPLCYLIPAVFAELATGTGFYYWKARLENSIKLKKENKQDETICSEIDQAVESASAKDLYR